MNRISPLASRRIVAALVASVGIGGSVAEAKTALRWKFKEGESLRYQTDQKTNIKGKDPTGQEMDQAFGLVVNLTWTVKSVAPTGEATISQTIDRLRTTATLPFGKFASDSSDPAGSSGPAGPVFKLLVGSEITFKMNARGEVADVKLSDKLAAALKGGDEPAGAQGQFSEAGLKNMIVQMGIVLPSEEIDPGATWVRKIPIPAGPDGQTRDVEQSFTLRGPDATSAAKAEGIDLGTKFEPIKPDPNVPFSIKSEEAKGRYLFDNASGRIESSELTQRVEVVAKIEGKETAMTTETVTTMTLGGDRPKP